VLSQVSTLGLGRLARGRRSPFILLGVCNLSNVADMLDHLRKADFSRAILTDNTSGRDRLNLMKTSITGHGIVTCLLLLALVGSLTGMQLAFNTGDRHLIRLYGGFAALFLIASCQSLWIHAVNYVNRKKRRKK
jgi:hypothetical protein